MHFAGDGKVHTFNCVALGGKFCRLINYGTFSMCQQVGFLKCLQCLKTLTLHLTTCYFFLLEPFVL